MHAGLVFLNGPVVAGDDAYPAPGAVVTLGDRIALIGSEDEGRAAIGPNTRVVDLGGSALLPGLNDNHTHPMSFGEMLDSIDASPGAAPTLARLQELFRAASDDDAGSGWLIARGYDDSRLDIHRHPTRLELDEATRAGRPSSSAPAATTASPTQPRSS